MRHQIVFPQYNADKPDKEGGILFKFLSSAGLRFLHWRVAYAGKSQGNPNKFYNKGTYSKSKAWWNGTQIMYLKNKITNKIHFYSGIPLTKWVLLTKMIGTVMSNRTGIPKEVKKNRQS